MKTTRGMQPDAAQSLNNAMQEMKQRGIPVNLNSGYRTPQEQEALYQKSLRGENPYPVAPPGQSRHQQGTAADLGIQPEHREAANAILAKHGWKWNGPSDAVHYDFSEALKGQGDANGTANQNYYTNLSGEGDGVDYDTDGQGDPLSSFQGKMASIIAGMNAIAKGGPQIPAYQPDPQIAGTLSQMQGTTQGLLGLLQRGAAGYGQPAAQAAPAGPSTYNPNAAPAAPGQNDTRPFWRKALDYGEDYLYNTVGNSGNNIGQRLNYAFKPVGDAANFATRGEINNIFQHTFSPLRAGVLQSLNQENLNAAKGGGEFGAYGPAGRSAIWQSMVKAWEGQQDPSLSGKGGVVSLLNGAPGAADDPINQVGDFLADWEAAGAFGHTFFSPIIRGAGTTLGKSIGSSLADAAEQGGLAAKPLGAAAALVDKGVGGNIRPVLDATSAKLYENAGNIPLGKQIAKGFQEITNSGEDYRQGQRVVREQTSLVREMQNRQAQVDQMIADLTKKTGAQMGNSLEGTHWMQEMPEVNGKNDSSLIGGLVTHYAEAGSQGAMFETPAEVLQQAAHLFPDNPDVINSLKNIGERVKAMQSVVGQASVDAKLMSPETFAENQGRYIQRKYILPNLTKDEASTMAEQLAAEGHANTDLFAKVQNVAQNGGAGEAGQMQGGGGMHGDIMQREITDPYERLSMLPDFDYTRATKNPMISQLTEAAKANILNTVADPQLGMSLANKMASETILHPKITDQPALQGEAARNAKEFAAIQNQFEKPGGVNETQNSLAAKLDKAVADAQNARLKAMVHYHNQPAEPPLPKLQPSIDYSAGPIDPPIDVWTHKQTGERFLMPNDMSGVPPDVRRQMARNETAIHLEGDRDTWWKGTRDELKSEFSRTEEPAPGLRSGGVINEKAVSQGTPLNRGDVLSVAGVARAIDAKVKALNSADLDQYAKDLTAHVKVHAKWQRTMNDLTDTVEKANDRGRAVRAAHDAHLLIIDNLNERAEQLNRRNELLSGNKLADDDDASDALAKALKKVDDTGQTAAEMTPQVQRALMDSWLQHWNDHNHDIFSDIPKGGLPRVPPGLPKDVVEAMGQNNPLIAMALGKGLSAADGEIDAAAAAQRGWTRWGGRGADYGAMDGRWGSAALKSFIDDAMDPHRFLGAQGEMAGVTKFLGEMMRSGKLYLNPVSHMNVHVQSIFDNMATAAEAGKHYNPAADLAGRKEWSEWLHGGPETDTVKAILENGLEMQGGPRQSIDPFVQGMKDPLAGLKEKGKMGAAADTAIQLLRSTKDAARHAFVMAQVLPKAGLVKMLMDQGMGPEEAATWAEKAHGGAGAEMGGVETPGVTKLAETLNRNGVAMFTSYPLHSMTRILQLMQNNPKVAMTYPVLRNYLMQQASPEMQQEGHDKVFGYDEVPIPTNNPIGRFFANPDGSQGVINVSNMIPYGGIYGGFGFPNALSQFTGADKKVNAIDRSGLNPVDAAGQVVGAKVQGALGAVFPDAQRVYNAFNGMTPQEGATKTQSVQQAITALVGLPFHNPETGLSRAFDPSKMKPIGGRLDFLNQLEDRYQNGMETGEPDMSGKVELRRMDFEQLKSALDGALKEATRITTDRALNNKQAFGMLRNQMGYIHSLNHLLMKQVPRAQVYADSQAQGAQQ